MTTGGTMIFFSAITFLGLIWVWCCLPELSGKSLEAIDAVFELPWYLIGRRGKELTKNIGGAMENLAVDKEKMDMVENVREVERKV